MRVPSDWECKGNMGGWIHKLNPDLVKRVRNVFRRTPKKKALLPKYWHDLVMKAEDAARVELLSCQLGVSEHALHRLMVGWMPEHKAWSFPMWDGSGRMIGIRLRGPNGKKWCVSGSFNGIFHPICVAHDDDSLLMICEGPTDCAALLDLGFDAIGRPNALGGVKYLTEFLRGGRRDVVIVADNDHESRVGMEGAVKLLQAIRPLTASVKILTAPGGYKDIRGWYNGGGTHDQLMELI
jgi:hypothetical protein